MRSFLLAAVFLTALFANEADAGDIEEVVVVGTRESGPVFATIAELCDEIPSDPVCALLNQGDDEEISMGPAPGPYPEPAPCGHGSTVPTCSCPAAGEEKVFDRSGNLFLCMAADQALTHRIDGCMRGAAPNLLEEVVPHHLTFGAVGGGEWGQAGRTVSGYYIRLDLDKIQTDLRLGNLGEPEGNAVSSSSSLSVGIHFVLGHEYVHHKWPDLLHGRLFNNKANTVRRATRKCK